VIVFTATHKESGKTFVGSARGDMESAWALLLTQAETGGVGDFFNLLRADGGAGFEVEEWAYAENPRELRDLMREAQQDLGAEPIKAGSAKPVKKKVLKTAQLRELMSQEESAGDDEPFSDWLAARRKETPGADVAAAVKPGLETPKPRPSAEDVSVTPQEGGFPAGVSDKLATGRTGSAEKERRIREAIEQQRDQREQLRQTRSTEEAAEMRALMAAIEGRRIAQRKKPTAKAASKTTKPAVPSTAVTAKVQPAGPEKPAAGRTGSSAKEKRIREAIEQQREEREKLRQTRSTEEAAEMRALMAAVEARRIAQKKKPSVKKKSATPTAGNAKATPQRSADPSAKTKSQSRSVADAAPASQAKGRGGSSAKEKRIKEAIAREKAERDSLRQSQAAAQADEMAAILARLDARGKEAEKYKRRR